MALVSEITIVRSEERHPGNLQRELYVVRRIRDEMKLDGDEPLSQLRQYCVVAGKRPYLFPLHYQEDPKRRWQRLARSLLASVGIPPAKPET